MRIWRGLTVLLCLVGAASMVPVAAAVDSNTGVVTDERLPSGVPLGGIGTGKVELLTNGTFGNLTLNNNWDHPLPDLPGSFFAVRATRGGKTTARVLALKSPYGLPTVGGVRYQGTYPKAQVRFTDDDLPVDVALTAFSPLVPQNLKDSGLPVALFTFTLTNPGGAPVDTSLAFSWENVLGCGGSGKSAWKDRTGNVQAIHAADGKVGLTFSSSQKHEGPRGNSMGDYALIGEAEGGRTTALSYWNAAGTGEEFWNSFSGATLFGDKPVPKVGAEGSVHPAGALAVSVSVPAQGSTQVQFVLGWNTPHFVTADGTDHGHAYSKTFPDAWAAANYASQYRETLLSGTTEWQDLVLKSSLPVWLKGKLLNDAFPLTANTLLDKDGKFSTLEASSDGSGSVGALDQWLLSRTLLASFYPQLDRDELKLYTDTQSAGGEPRRLLGTLEAGYGAAGSPAGATGWPDVACNYILATYRQYRWTGDADAMKAAYPAVQKAFAWLKSRDADGDGIPEGGSTWDYQHYPGTFSYTASLYLASLRAGEAMARANLDKKTEDELRERYKEARATAMAQLWNGRYFTKYLNPVTADRSTNLFAGALAGEWAGEQLGLADQYDPAVVDTGLRSLLDVLPPSGSFASPNEIRADGTAEPRLSDLSWGGHLETYIGALGIARNRADSGLALVKRVHDVQSGPGRGPWDGALGYSAASGTRQGSGAHISTLASWNVYEALTGVTLDEPSGTLAVAPNLATGWTGLHAPLFAPRYWAWIDYARNPSNAATDLRLKLVKKFDDRPVLLNGLTTVAPAGTKLEELTLIVTGPAGAVEGKAEISGGRLRYTFKAPVEWRPGETMEMNVVPPDANNIVLAFAPNQVVSYGSVVTAKDLHKDDEIRFTLVNPTKERQVVNVRFRSTPDRNYEVYKNGVLVQRFTPDNANQRLPLVVQASTIGFERVETLRQTANRLQAAREQATREGRLAPLEGTLGGLQEKLDAALKADETARSTQVLMHPYRKNVVFRNKLKEPPAVVVADDAEPAVTAAEEALAQAPRQLAAQVSDPALRSLVLNALHPVRVGMVAVGEPVAGKAMRFRVTVANESRQPVTAALSFVLPQGWTGPETAPRLTVGPGETDSAEISVKLPESLATSRHRLGGTATLSTGGSSWSTPIAAGFGHAYIREWAVIGTWPGAGEKALDDKLPPDTELDPSRSYEDRKWRVIRGATDTFTLAALFAKGSGVGYAVTQVFSPTERDVALELRTDGGVLVRLNGEQTFRRYGSSAARERVPLHLRQGWNTLMLKLQRAADSWGLEAEITDLNGFTPAGIRFNPDLEK